MKVSLKDVLRELRRRDVRFAVNKYDVQDAYKYLKKLESAIKSAEGKIGATRTYYKMLTKSNVGFFDKELQARSIKEMAKYILKEITEIRDSAQMLEMAFKSISNQEANDWNNRNH